MKDKEIRNILVAMGILLHRGEYTIENHEFTRLIDRVNLIESTLEGLISHLGLSQKFNYPVIVFGKERKENMADNE